MRGEGGSTGVRGPRVRVPLLPVLCAAWLVLASTPAAAEGPDPITEARAAIDRGDTMLKAGKVTAACNQYELAVALASEWWYAAYKKALCAVAFGDRRDAEYLLSSLTLGGRELYAPALALARVTGASGDPVEANRLYETALQVNGAALEPMVELADLLVSSGRPNEAELVLKRAAYYSPGNVAVRSRLARVAESLQHPSVAEEEYRYVALQGVDRRRGLAELARFYQRQGKAEAAQRVLAVLRDDGSPEDLPPSQFSSAGTL